MLGVSPEACVKAPETAPTSIHEHCIYEHGLPGNSSWRLNLLSSNPYFFHGSAHQNNRDTEKQMNNGLGNEGERTDVQSGLICHSSREGCAPSARSEGIFFCLEPDTLPVNLVDEGHVLADLKCSTYCLERGHWCGDGGEWGWVGSGPMTTTYENILESRL